MSLRLRLCIQRYSTPEVNSLWVVELTDDLTVAKLLGQINDVFTLESGDWGLEDYAVQLAGSTGDRSRRWYECLHFQKVGKLFKDMDEVLIRSLLSDDLRQRRLSGRNQISADGKHLVDGLAFGRPWLRPPRDRPLVELPPRKRAKLLGGEEEHDEIPEQLLLEGIDTAGRESDNESESEDDADFVPSAPDIQAVIREESNDDSLEELAEDSEDDLDAELALLKADNAIIQDGTTSELNDETGAEHGLFSTQALSDDEFSGFPDSSPAKPLPQAQEDIFDRTTKLSFEEKVELLRKAWPYHPTGSIRGALASSRENVRQAYNVLLQTGEAECAYADLVFEALTMNAPSSLCQKPASTSTPALHSDTGSDDSGFIPAKHPPRPLIQEVEIFEDPETSIADASGKPTNRDAVEEDSDETSSSGSDEDSDSDDDFFTSERDSSEDDSSDSQASDSESQVFVDAVPTVAIAAVEESDSSSDDSSDASSDKDPDEGIIFQKGHKVAQDMGSDDDADLSSSESSDSSSDSDSISSSPEETSSKPQARPVPSPLLIEPVPSQANEAKSPPPPTEQTVAPGKGLNQTQKRNRRRRKLRQIQREATRQEAIKAVENSNKPEASLAQQLLARKQALLAAVLNDDQEDITTTEQLASHNETVEPPQQADASQPVVTDAPALANDGGGTVHATTADVSDRERPSTTAAPVADSHSRSQADSSQRKSRFDVGAGRRMLFGALGLKTPKTKADEDKLKSKLMEDVRPLKNHRVETETVAGVESEEPSQVEDPDAWKDKINYRAVECCHEGMALSEPPFPFVQRWDPQQKFSSMRKRKRQSQEYYYDDYCYEENYDDSQDWCGDEETVSEPAPKKKKKGKKKKSKVTDQPETLSYDDVPHQAAATESQFTDTDDLPSLPEDVTTLPTLQLGEVKPSMVITWKQLQMDKSTNWQPQQASMTALVISGVDNETNMLHVVLAKRNREKDTAEYDYSTGKRVYDKFEMPQDEDEEGQEDDGHRDMDWTDLMDVRLVQIEPSSSTFASPDKRKPVTSDLLPSIEKDRRAPNAKGTQEAVIHSQAHRLASSSSGLDTQTVMAGVQADLTHAAASTESTSIQSGQHVPPDVQVSVELMTSYSTDNGEPKDFKERDVDEAKIQEKETFEDVFTSEGSNSPTRQLEIHVGAAPPLVTSRIGERSVEQAVDSPLESLIQVDDDAPLLFDDEPELPPVDGDPVGEPPSPALHRGSAPVVYPRLTVPSSIASPGSGRQPEEEKIPVASYGLHTNADSLVPETVPVIHESLSTHLERKDTSVSQATSHRVSHTTETPKLENPARNFPNTSSPLASLEEVFHTAVTSRLTQSPSRSTQQSVLPSGSFSSKSNFEYEEAMRRLDEGEDSDFSPDRNKSIRGLFPNATQPAPDTSSARVNVDGSLLGFDSKDLDGFEIRDLTSSPSRTRSKWVSRTSKDRTFAPATTKGNRMVKTERNFIVPEDSQVISIDSSPVPSEKYADEEVDGDWGDENGVDGDEDWKVPSRKAGTGAGKAKAKPRQASGSSSLPKGPGWAKKSNGQSSQVSKSTRRSSSRV